MGPYVKGSPAGAKIELSPREPKKKKTTEEATLFSKSTFIIRDREQGTEAQLKRQTPLLDEKLDTREGVGLESSRVHGFPTMPKKAQGGKKRGW